MAGNQAYSGSDTEEIVQDIHKLEEPPRYAVILHNDDYTTMEFVIAILIAVFHNSESEAVKIMLHIHEKGKGLCGIYSQEIAEARVALVHKQAEKNGFPLLCTMERTE